MQSRQVEKKNYTCTHSDLDVLQEKKKKNNSHAVFESELSTEGGKKRKVEAKIRIISKRKSETSCTGDEELKGEL